MCPTRGVACAITTRSRGACPRGFWRACRWRWTRASWSWTRWIVCAKSRPRPGEPALRGAASVAPRVIAAAAASVIESRRPPRAGSVCARSAEPNLCADQATAPVRAPLGRPWRLPRTELALRVVIWKTSGSSSCPGQHQQWEDRWDVCRKRPIFLETLLHGTTFLRHACGIGGLGRDCARGSTRGWSKSACVGTER